MAMGGCGCPDPPLPRSGERAARRSGEPLAGWAGTQGVVHVPGSSRGASPRPGMAPELPLGRPSLPLGPAGPLRERAPPVTQDGGGSVGEGEAFAPFGGLEGRLAAEPRRACLNPLQEMSGAFPLSLPWPGPT